jgi:dCTP deaminase
MDNENFFYRETAHAYGGPEEFKKYLEGGWDGFDKRPYPELALDEPGSPLSDKRIKRAMQAGHIIIEPFNAKYLGPNSYDVRLGSYYYRGRDQILAVHLNNEEDVKAYWNGPLCAHKEIEIHPGTTILAHTIERIGGQNGYVAQMHSKSTIARCGLSVCRCAGVGDVGYINRWTMEILNGTKIPIWVPVGAKIAQFSFHYAGETDKEYHGHYGQDDWQPSDMLPNIDSISSQ